MHISNADELDVSVTVMTRELPRECIAAAWGNREAQEQLPRYLHYLTTTDYLTSHARLSVEREDVNGANVLVPYWCGRVIPVEYGSYPAQGIECGVVCQKGGLVAGVPYLSSKHLATNDPVYSYGYLNSIDAVTETEASNISRSYGLRTSMVLGTILLDPRALEHSIRKLWLVDRLSQDVLIQTLRNMVKKGKTPALIMRLNSQLARIEPPMIDYSFSMHHSDGFDERHKAVLIAQQRIAFGMWLRELQQFPDETAQDLGTSGCQRNELISVLDTLTYSPIGTADGKDLATFFAYYSALVNSQKEKAMRMFREHGNEPRCVRALNSRGRGKDTEWTYMRTDFEADPHDSDEPNAMDPDVPLLQKYGAGLDKIAESQCRVLRLFFRNAERADMRIFEALEKNGIHISELFLKDL